MQKKSPSNPQRGAVLIMVLIILTGLSAIAINLSHYAFLDYAQSNSNRLILSSKILAESAENLAAKMLVASYNKDLIEDTITPPSIYTGAWQRISRELKSYDLDGVIEDENGFFPLNRILYTSDTEKHLTQGAQDIMFRLLTELLKSHGHSGTPQQRESLAEEILLSMLQWGGTTTLNQTAEDWYLGQKPPRLPPKRPFINPHELSLIYFPVMDKKLQKRLLYGTQSTPGLIQLVSTWTMGPMNINHMHPSIIPALINSQTQLAEFTATILQNRQNIDIIKNHDWYEDIFTQYGGIPVPRGLLDSRTRVYRVNVKIGVGQNIVQLTSIGTVFTTKVNWHYRTIK